MKRILFILLVSIGCTITAKAQYNPYFDALMISAVAADISETYKLENIRFDENALRQNPDVWTKYTDYLFVDQTYRQKINTFSIVGWTGIGVMATSFIPLLINSDSDAIFGVSYGLLGAGTIISCVGLVGLSVQLGKIKNNKKDFIYYLKTTNNGVGIVSIF